MSDTLSDRTCLRFRERRVMNTKKILAITLLGLSFTACAMANESTSIRMGDGTVRGERLNDYQNNWLQCAKQEDGWVTGAQLAETLVSIGEVLRHTQRAEQSNGMVGISTTYSDRDSLAPLRMERQVTASDGHVVATVTRTLDEKGYNGARVRPIAARRPPRRRIARMALLLHQRRHVDYRFGFLFRRHGTREWFPEGLGFDPRRGLQICQSL